VSLAIDWSTAEPTAGQFDLAVTDIANAYYPAHGTRVALTVRPVSTTYRAAYPGRPIHFNQLGYPSSSTNGSSQTKQREFVAQAFAAWDAHADQVPVINFTWQTDLSQAAVDAFQDLYGLHEPALAEFLRTLGLRTFPAAGADKPAWTELQHQAAIRGW
jgi:hypothetical protein